MHACAGWEGFGWAVQGCTLEAAVAGPSCLSLQAPSCLSLQAHGSAMVALFHWPLLPPGPVDQPGLALHISFQAWAWVWHTVPSKASHMATPKVKE